MSQQNIAQNQIKRRFGTEADIEALTGIRKKTLQKHRLFGKGFPYYKIGGRVFYDLEEVVAIVTSTRRGAAA